MRIDSRTAVEIIGSVGVIASLVFVGVQVQQGSEATRSATVLQLKGAWVQLNIEQATSRELNDAFEDAEKNGYDNASFSSRAAVNAFYKALFHNLSNAYYQYRIGTLDEELWSPHLAEIRTFPERPTVVRVWRDWKHLYDKAFQDVVDDVMKGHGR